VLPKEDETSRLVEFEDPQICEDRMAQFERDPYRRPLVTVTEIHEEEPEELFSFV
jgi:hypothetical protein